MEHKLRGAIVGCGSVSEWHLRGWRRIPEVEVVALVDRDVSRAEQRRSQAPAARLYTELDAAIECENLDFVDILTPPGEHAGQCESARAAALHILCCPPLCDNLAEAQALARNFGQYTHVFAIDGAHLRRAWFRRLAEMHRAGRFGWVAMARFEEVHPADERGHGGVWLECGTQLVDLMRGLMGEPAGVYARMHKGGAASAGEDLVHAVFEYPGATAIVDVAWVAGEPPSGSVSLTGTAGVAIYEAGAGNGAGARLMVCDASVRTVTEMPAPGEDYGASIWRHQCDFVNAMRGGPEMQNTGEHLKTLEYVFAAYRSAAEGLPVGL